MEAGLHEEEEELSVTEWELAHEKLKEVLRMAAPMVPVALSQYLFRIVAMVMVGHLGQIALSGVALATSVTNLFGYSLIYGMACGLETPCGQAYGAKQYHKLGLFTFSAIIFLSIFCVPLSLLLVFMENLLILLHQDPQISKTAAIYSIWLIPSLFAFASLQSLIRFFQSQKLVFPMLLSALMALGIHVPLCWLLVYKLELGITGAALSLDLSFWFNAIFLWIFMKFSPLCENTRIVVTKDLWPSTKEFLTFAVPSAVMVCLEMWSSEVIILLSGFLPNSKLETSVLSICFTTKLFHFFVAYAIASSASTKVSNELGAGHPRAARATAYVAIAITALESVIAGIALFLCRRFWGRIFTGDKEIIDYAAQLTPLLSLTIIVDSLLAVLCGIARGSGWQRIGAYINLGAYYAGGLPVAAFFGFFLHWRGKGLWIGVLAGCVVQTFGLSLLVFFTDWDKEARKARGRAMEGTRQQTGR